ncbi:hypothetical protein [Streptomyces sp. NEAU-174]|uniref:hypothetical protein n=1 Tax=Streptomyces sp. NEAU-174 TaxID=3458254 RepID=UPI00404404BB
MPGPLMSAELQAAGIPGARSSAWRDCPPPHPYEAAYLPVNRLRDGTIHDW